MRTDTRARMVNSAAHMLGERGVAGTTITGVLQHGDAPRGSVGHHFSGGRGELLTDALRSVGDAVAARLRQAAESGLSASQVYSAIAEHYRARLIDSGFTAGCPVWAGAQEAYADQALGPVVAELVDEWVGLLADALVRSGHDGQRATQIATVCVSALEGAITMSRVRRSVEPIDLTFELVAPHLAVPDVDGGHRGITSVEGVEYGQGLR